MGWQVIFAPQAIAQLEQIVRFIAQDDPQAAIRFGNYLVDRAESLANFPELGTPIGNDPMCDGCCVSHTSSITVSVARSR